MASQLNHPGKRQTIGLVSEGSTCGRGRLTTLDMITTVLNPTTNEKKACLFHLHASWNLQCSRIALVHFVVFFV